MRFKTVFAAALALLLPLPAHAFTVTVVGPADEAVGAYRYLVEEDNTLPVAPGSPSSRTPGVGIERSHAKVVAAGTSDAAGSPVTVSLPANRRYFVSVLPSSSYTLGGAPVDIDVQAVTVHVPKQPVPTAQVTVFAFEDGSPLNGRFDLPAERRLEGFGVVLSDRRGPLTVDALGNPLGVVHTDARGEAAFRNLLPGRYQVQLVPPEGSGWIQTSAPAEVRVGPGAPPFVDARADVGWTASVGFVRETPLALPLPLGASATALHGRVAFIHENRPPLDPGSNTGHPVPGCYVGLNDLSRGRQVFAARCAPDSTFQIDGVPPGRYQLVAWDGPHDALLDVRTLELPAEGASLDLGEVGLYVRFGRFSGSVFEDQTADGFAQPFESGLPGELVQLRQPDGSLYGSATTDAAGRFAFPEVLALRHFLVADAATSALQTTGATIVVDDGGPLAQDAWNTPQLQPGTSILGLRIESGPPGAEHSQAMTLFPGTTNEIHWGKQSLRSGHNGGIAGMVRYSPAPAQAETCLADAEPWAPGVPRVEVRLYEDFLDNATSAAVPDGIPDGPAVASTFTSSFDDALPAGCVYPLPEQRPQVHGAPMPDCAENGLSYAQVRPGVYDGRYRFGPDLPAGSYVVEVVPPEGYLLAPVSDLERPGCDRRQVVVSDRGLASADFVLTTEVPKAARLRGRVGSDESLEMAAGSIDRNEPLRPSWMPVSLKDFTGRELVRVYTDEWGRFNALAPSALTGTSVPSPLAPNAIGVFVNDPGPVPNPNWDPSDPDSPELITDPHFDPRFAVGFGESWELLPGRTTDVEATIRPIAAFAANTLPVDAGFPSGTPVIAQVSGPEGGPYVRSVGDRITLTAVGALEVPNPDWDPSSPQSTKTVVRDYGFGPKAGEVTVGGVPLTGLLWSADGHAVSATIGPKVRSGQLALRRGDNHKSTLLGITLHVGPPAVLRARPTDRVQDLIDTAPDGALLVLSPGVYRQNLILWKPLELQGSGAGSTVIDCRAFAGDQKRRDAWQERLETLLASGDLQLPPGAAPDFERGACITVAGKPGRFTERSHPVIDGLTVTGASETGGGILAYAHARFLQVTNCTVAGNQGSLGGGIRVGIPGVDAGNEDVVIRSCHVRQNGSLFGAGGGIALYPGSDRYRVSESWIVGNRAFTDGGGIAHLGLSRGGRIAHNVLASNEAGRGGGGLYLGGDRVAAGAPAGTLSEGAGSVALHANLVQGNLAHGGDGGGLLVERFNGQDVKRSPEAPQQWWVLSVTSSVVVDNASAGAGGGIALSDTAAAVLFHDTVAANDATSTSPESFGAGLARSVPQPAGIVLRAHSPGLARATRKAYSPPAIVNSIVWQNRALLWDVAADSGRGALRSSAFSDLALLGAEGRLEPRSCLLTNLEGADPSNFSADPKFLQPYFNEYRAASAGSERGHFVAVTLAPAGVRGDYHVALGSPAVGRGDLDQLELFAASWPELRRDLDGEPRPDAPRTPPVVGADERPGGPLRPDQTADQGGPSARTPPPGIDGPRDRLEPLTPPDAGYDFGLGVTGHPPPGCGCTAAGDPAVLSWLLAAAGIAALRRRRD